MTRLDIQLEVPDSLARKARQAGLLSPERLESLLREALRKQASERLFAAMDRMAAADEPAPMTAEEIQAEIEAARRERRAECSICESA
jgi:hypothetical protein